MAEFQFRSKATGAIVPQGDVDTVVKSITNEQPRTDEEGNLLLSRWYCEGLIPWAFVGFMRANTWDNAKALKWLKKHKDEIEIDPQVLALIEQVFAEYKMEAWRK